MDSEENPTQTPKHSIEDLQRFLRQSACHVCDTTGDDSDIKKLEKALSLPFEDVPDFVADQYNELDCLLARKEADLELLEAALRPIGRFEDGVLVSSSEVGEYLQFKYGHPIHSYGWTVQEKGKDSFLTRPVNDVESTRYFPTFLEALNRAIEEKWTFRNDVPLQ